MPLGERWILAVHYMVLVRIGAMYRLVFKDAPRACERYLIGIRIAF